MDNLAKIKKVSKLFNILLTALIVIMPIYFISYWLFINSFSQNIVAGSSVSFEGAGGTLTVGLQVIGFLSSLFPLGAIIYGLVNTKKIFALYIDGVIFSDEHVILFKKIAKAFAFWVLFSVIHESIKSVVFSWNNAVGNRQLDITFGSIEFGVILMSVLFLVIAWIMDEGRTITEENQLTV